MALQLFRWAASIRDWVVLANWPPQYEVALRFFVDERQIVYVGFVLASRIIVGLLIILVARMLGRRRSLSTRSDASCPPSAPAGGMLSA